MAGEWEVVLPANEEWEPVMNAPASPQVSYTDPNQIVQQTAAQQQSAADQLARTQAIAATREEYGPFEAGMYAGSNELMQPVIGAARLPLKISGLAPRVNDRLDNISRVMENQTQMLRDAYPAATTVGQMAPYMLTAPAANLAYMKGVSKLAPGFMRNTLARPLPSMAIPGAVEGGLMAGFNPYQSGTQGAMLGAGGNMLGHIGTSPLAKGPTNLNQYGKDVLDIAKDWKITGHPNKSVYDYMMPGARTGNIGLKEVDDAIATQGQMAGAVRHRFDVPQQEINRRVLRTAGLDTDMVNPGDLYKNQRALGRQYDELEKQATPTFTENHFNVLEEAKDTYLTNRGVDKSAWLDKIEREFPTNDISLTEYRTMKNLLNKRIKGLEGSPLDPERFDQLTYLKKVKGNLQSMLRSSDPNIEKQLRSLDSKYAASRFLEENRIVDSGQVDAKRLYAAMNTKMPKQLAALSGPWSDMAKAAHLGKYIEDSRNATLGMRSQVNSLMGSRQHKRGILGNLTKFGAPSKFLPEALIARYAYANPQKGLLRLPEVSPLIGGGLTSGAARGSLMDRESPY